MEKTILAMQVALSAVVAWVSAKLGILAPVLGLLLLMMVIDYLSGMAASKKEAIDHPGDASYGWSCKKGAKGIIKKVGYACVIVVAMVLDYITVNIAGTIGINMPGKAFLGLLVAIWYILNEILSIIENAGRMGANVPEWLTKYIAVLKNKIDDSSESEEITKTK